MLLKRKPLASDKCLGYYDMLGFGWLFLLGGLFGLMATRLGWLESGILKEMDWFDLHHELGGRTGSYFLYTLSAVAGLAMLLYAHFSH